MAMAAAVRRLAVVLIWTLSSTSAASSVGSEQGPYRPNLYFGVRPRIPETLLMGLMWSNGNSRNELISNLRDTCEQDDGMEGYGWTQYDTRVGGSQTIHDSNLQIDLTTKFFKTSDGLSWGVRVFGAPRPGAPADLKTALIWHVAVEKAESLTDQRNLKCSSAEGAMAGTSCTGTVPRLGSFELQLRKAGDAESKGFEDSAIRSVTVPEEKIWKAKSVYKDVLKSASENTLLVDGPGDGNMHFIQAILKGSFSIDITFRSDGGAPLAPDVFNTAAETFYSSFPDQIEAVFPRTAPYQSMKCGNFTSSLLSNLLGDQGFFFGDTRVDYSNDSAYEETSANFWVQAENAMKRATITNTPPTSLFSHVPSRPFFPRGFLWDEGFHLLPVTEWDLDLAVSILQSWLGRMDDDGWIEREQILGEEARSKVPKQFQTQYPHYANPPTISLLLPLIISKITKETGYSGHESVYITNPDKARSLLEQLYLLFKRQYDWFRRTQAGNFSAYPRPQGASTEGYRWKGRSLGHTLTSGLDDYPRAEPPHPGELHVDALAWVGAMASALEKAAEYLGDETSIHTQQLEDVRRNLDVLHWDDKASAYCDATIGSDGQFQHVCHLGYMSLMPLLLGHLNSTHPNLPAVLDLLGDSNKLMSPYGLRSLSAEDKEYHTDEDYWRGAIWMNINVLAVLRLRDIGADDNPQGVRARKFAADLRTRVVDTVFDSFEKTGFVWEQYNDQTGEGQRSRAFTGWTASVILLMGLDFGSDALQEGSRTTSTRWYSMSAVLLAVSIVVVAAFRRQFIATCARVMQMIQEAMRRSPTRREYEEVVDLDELEHAENPRSDNPS
ncbi:glycoside hydrolase family 63 protein [Pestalotiopsis sp. NC0098]|nr:glycoside hydrolase family 63 protein [Pestalotiopsis sp. NC0098]